MKRLLVLVTSHLLVLAFGFALGVYALPILTAPDAPPMEQVKALSKTAMFSGTFKRDLKGSDLFHWGEGTLHINPDRISFMGELAPGPDYKLYLTHGTIEDEADFLEVKDEALLIGDIKTFDNFIVPITTPVDVSGYTTAVVWCESFGEFITSAQFQ